MAPADSSLLPGRSDLLDPFSVYPLCLFGGSGEGRGSVVFKPNLSFLFPRAKSFRFFPSFLGRFTYDGG